MSQKHGLSLSTEHPGEWHRLLGKAKRIGHPPAIALLEALVTSVEIDNKPTETRQ
jgi:hypothetical protein